MRRYDEPIEVVEREGEPVRFRWNRKRWHVTDIETRWVETADWWHSPRVRAARGSAETASSADLLSEHAFWRVVAIAEGSQSSGVYELAYHDGQWRLYRAVD